MVFQNAFELKVYASKHSLKLKYLYTRIEIYLLLRSEHFYSRVILTKRTYLILSIRFNKKNIKCGYEMIESILYDIFIQNIRLKYKF